MLELVAIKKSNILVEMYLVYIDLLTSGRPSIEALETWTLGGICVSCLLIYFEFRFLKSQW